MAESEADKNKSDLFSSIGALVGMVAGGRSETGV
jgi:divalent metal cation (Fe/Co/Zn/Cd) transporter